MIKIIYHLADIHIPEKAERHEEYREVFKKVREKIKEETREKMVVICGDYFDVKHISGTTLQLGIEILSMLSENCEVVLFGGNHDINARNENNVPYIEAITGDNIIYKNKVHYIKENKIYKINGINFVLTSITANKVTEIENRKTNEIYIGLYHGTLQKSKFSNEMIITNNKLFSANNFKEFDITMLGDIHVFQYMNKEKTIAYSSSVIQQNYGETIKNHGMLKWEIKTKKSEFIEIENEYIFKTHIIEDVTNTTIPDIMNKKVKLRLQYKNKKREEIKDYIKKIKEQSEENKFELLEIFEEELTDEKKELTENNKIIDRGFMEVYKEYLNETKQDENIEITEQLKKYVEKYLQKEKHVIRNVRLKSIEFENLFNYGKKNNINFESLKGMNILTGKNGIGKSSIVDIILFVLFRKFSRGEGHQALNIRYENGYGKIKLELNNNLYEITRTLRKNKEEISILKNGQNVSLNGKKNDDMHIIEIFGTKDDMIMTSLLLQSKDNFIDMKESEQQSALTNILRLDIYDNIESEVKIRLGDISKNIIKQLEKELTNIDYKKEIEKIEKEIIEKNIVINEVEKQKDKLLKEEIITMSKIDNKILNMDQKILMSEIETYTSNYKKIIIKLKETNYTNETLQELIEGKEKIIINNDKLNDAVKKLLQSKTNVKKVLFDSTRYNKLIEEEKILITKRDELLVLLEKVQNEYKTITNYEKILEEEETKLKICENNNNEKQNKEQILKILEEKNEKLLKHQFSTRCKSCKINKEIHNEMGYMQELEKIKKDIGEYEVINVAEIKNKINNIKEIQNLVQKIEIINSKIEIHEKSKKIEENNMKLKKEYDESIKKNENINKKILEHEQLIQNNKNEYNNIQEIIKLINRKKELEEKINEKQEIIEKIKLYSDEIEKIKKILFEKKVLEEKYTDEKKSLMNAERMLLIMKDEEKKQEKIIKEYKSALAEEELLTKIKILFKLGFKEYAKKNRTSVLEDRINNFLRKIADFEICIDTNEGKIQFFKIVENVSIQPKITNNNRNNKIKIINDDELVNKKNKEVKYLIISECSGYERTAFNIALRLALNSLNVANRNNFIFIDEQFSTADHKNLGRVINLLETIKKEYEVCIIISHLNEIKEINENKIEIKYNNLTHDSNIFIE